MARTLNGRRPDPGSAHHTIITMLLVLAALLGLGLLFANAKIQKVMQHSRVVARMGPDLVLESLPSMQFPLGDGHRLDLKVSLELLPQADRQRAAPYLDRIGDRLTEKIAGLGPRRLNGQGAADLVKSSVSDTVNREVGRRIVKTVLIEEMLMR
jgi:flagellar basal body-associated protein FliL